MIDLNDYYTLQKNIGIMCSSTLDEKNRTVVLRTMTLQFNESVK